MEVFTDIYRNRKWGGGSVSGPGSDLSATRLVREALPSVFERHGIRTLLDAPCGDAGWISKIAECLDLYLGVDVVPDLVASGASEGGAPNMFFRRADITRDWLPAVDAVFCRDCLVHLPLEMGRAAVENFRASGTRLLISTTFPSVPENIDVGIGGWRRLNLQLPPFSLPAPVELLPERAKNPDDPYNDKSLGIWELR